jgi:hypothetical protein
MKKCPSCRLVNPPTAETCDCGYTWRGDGQVRPLFSAEVPPVVEREPAKAQVLMGLAMLLLGLYAVWTSITSPQPGNGRIMGLGAIVAGGFALYRGLTAPPD